jgi:hypothetical protein
MISAIAKRRLALRKADGSFITVKPGEFVSLPEEVQHDPMYAWAVRDGVLVVSQQVIAPVEKDVKVEEPEVKAEESPAPKKNKKKAADK